LRKAKRHFARAIGRFASPDPGAPVDPANPASLYLHAHVEGDSVNDWECRVLKCVLGAVISTAALLSAAAGQTVASTAEICSAKVAVLPAAANQDMVDKAPAQRFELRSCEGGGLQVLLFEIRSDRPAVAEKIPVVWPRLLFHVFNILVIQTGGGSSGSVYIFRFHNGKAAKVERADTRGAVEVLRNEADYQVTVNVPREPGPGSARSGRKYTFPIETLAPEPEPPPTPWALPVSIKDATKAR
jgi:hypothetical protein